MNEFSILCRVLGSLYYRQPQDPLLVPLLSLIHISVAYPMLRGRGVDSCNLFHGFLLCIGI